MSDFPPISTERDPRFPSGKWSGFYLQYWLPGRHDTNLELTFSQGEMTGNGDDRVGQFTIAGQYDLRSGDCSWTKQYIGRHRIAYRGTNNGRGIWGVWELPQLWGLFIDRGGFHIWPEGADVTDESAEAEQALLQLMRQQFGPRMLRLARFVLALCVLTTAAIVVRIIVQHLLAN
jgi:hypothetical protein